MDTFIVRLRDLMAEKEIKEISHLAKLTDVPRTTINNWFNHRNRPQIDALLKLSAYFGCSVDYLLGVEKDY